MAHRNGGGQEKSYMATVSFVFGTCGQEDDRDDEATAVVYNDDKIKMMWRTCVRA